MKNNSINSNLSSRSNIALVSIIYGTWNSEIVRIGIKILSCIYIINMFIFVIEGVNNVKKEE